MDREIFLPKGTRFRQQGYLPNPSLSIRTYTDRLTRDKYEDGTCRACGNDKFQPTVIDNDPFDVFFMQQCTHCSEYRGSNDTIFNECHERGATENMFSSRDDISRQFDSLKDYKVICDGCQNANQDHFEEISGGSGCDEWNMCRCFCCDTKMMNSASTISNEEQSSSSYEMEAELLHKFVSSLDICQNCTNVDKSRFETINIDHNKYGFGYLAIRRCLECHHLHGVDDSFSHEQAADWIRSLLVCICPCGNSDSMQYKIVSNEETTCIECLKCSNIIEMKESQGTNPKSKVVAQEPIKSNKNLKPGDHVGIWKFQWWHHLLVVDVIDDRYVTAIHYTENGSFVKKCLEGKFLEKGIVMEEEVDLWEPSGLPHKMIYDGPCNTPEDTIYKARLRLGEVNYNILRQNCEHFVTECKTDKAKCNQVKEAGANVSRVSNNSYCSVLGQCVSQLADDAVAAGAKVAAVNVDEALVAGAAVGKNAFKAASNFARAAPYAVPAVAITGIELIATGKTIYDAYQNKKKGLIGREQFLNVVIGKSTKGAIRAGGAIAGTCIGQFVIPIPFLGGIVGGILGTIIGNVIGSIADRKIVKYRSFSKK